MEGAARAQRTVMNENNSLFLTSHYEQSAKAPSSNPIPTWCKQNIIIGGVPSHKGHIISSEGRLRHLNKQTDGRTLFLSGGFYG